MKITNVEMKKLEIPFDVSFRHASAERNCTESILVVIVSECGFVGYGEACPRSYVTDETIETSEKFFQQHKFSIQRIENIQLLRRWVEKNKDSIDANPAAWCAIELAILDLLGQAQGETVENILALQPLTGAFRYTAVLGANTFENFQCQLEKYAHIGFKDYKMKISGRLKNDKKNLGLLKKLVSRKNRIRVDANNLWHTSRGAIAYLMDLGGFFFAVEEPLYRKQYDALRTVARALGCKIILDESFTRVEQFSQIRDDPETWIVNLRVSKMGGILRSINVAQAATLLGVPIIVGAQVGETSILTRAALLIANTYRKSVLAQEGAFGTYLLKRDIVETPLMFGKGGILSVPPSVVKPGLGLDYIL